MANVGTAAAGKTLIGAGNGSSPTYASIGTNSGLTAHGVVLAEGNGAFTATSVGTTGQVLTGVTGADPIWTTLGASTITLTGNTGGTLGPSGSFNILGTGSLTIVGSGTTLTVQLTGLTNHAVLVGAGTATITNVGPTATAGQVLQSTGSTTDPAFSTATYPVSTTINQVLFSSATNTVTGIPAANNGTLISSTTGVPSWLANGTTGQVLTATTGSPPSWQPVSATTLTLTGNTGGAISPSSNNFNVITANTTVKFAGTTGTETLNFGLTNLIIGSSATSISSATLNVGVGNTALTALTSGAANNAIGYQAGQSLTSGAGNCIMGYNSLQLATTSLSNMAIGSNTLASYVGNGLGNNVAIGDASLINLGTGEYNIAIGTSSGGSLVSANSSNILLSNPGVGGDANTIRIGSQGSSGGQQNKAFMAGITGVTVAGSPVLVSTTGQLSTMSTGTSGQVLKSTGSSTSPTFQQENSYSLQFGSGILFATPVDATTYYITPFCWSAPWQTAIVAASRVFIAKAGTLTAAFGAFSVSGTLGTTEPFTVAIRVNDTTNTNITTTLTASTTFTTFSNNALSIALNAGDFICIQVITPTWATNPTNVFINLTMFVS